MKLLKKELLNFDFFDRSAKRVTICSKNLPQEFFPLIGLFAMDCHYHLIKLYTDHNRLFIEGSYKGKYNELMLRVDPDSDIGLVIARVCFIHQRKGNMGRLVEILEHIRRTNRYGEIMIESVVSPEMKSWVKKNGWLEIDPGPKMYFFGDKWVKMGDGTKNFLSPNAMKRYLKKINNKF